MDFLNDTEGTVLFPFQTEIAFVLAIITTAKDLSVSAWGGGAHRTETILGRLSLYLASGGLRGTLCRGGLGCSPLA